MDDDDRDALAAEYVLGTLSAQEREEAEALLARDVGFAETIRLWEHRLGELNVMVEAVEPPPDLWERIKTGIDGAERRSQAASETVELTGMQAEPAKAAVSSNGAGTETSAEPDVETVPDLLSGQTQSFEDSKTADTADLASADHASADLAAADLAAADLTSADVQSADLASADLASADLASADLASPDLASSLLASQPATEFEGRLPRWSASTREIPIAADPVDRHHTVGPWRGLAIAASLIALLLAAYIAVGWFAPGVVSRPQHAATAGAPKPASVPQLVAVLQQEPTPPAFLVMLDPQQRTVTVRRLTAAPDGGRSYELWLYSPKSPRPASLGAVGSNEITSRPIPQNVDVETMRSATYAVSLEPGTGAASAAPTGPILFKGRMIEAVPGSSG